MSTRANPLLWKVQNAPLYLMSSIHCAPPGGYDFGSAFWEIFDSAEEVFFEIPREEMAIAQTLAKRTSGSLAEDLGPELYEKVRKSHLYEARFEDLIFPFVPLNLGVWYFKEINLIFNGGVDAMLMQRAEDNGQKCRGLETAADQVAAISSISRAEAIRDVQRTLDEPEKIIAVRDCMIPAYVTGDEGGIAWARAYAKELNPSMYSHVLEGRETKWCSRLLDFNLSVPKIVVVGTLHLPGDDGLVSLLQARGLEIERAL